AVSCTDRRSEQRQVGPVETGDDGIAFLDPEARADIGDDSWGGGCSEREHAFRAELPGARGELQIVGAEVVAPLGDAMRLVDREQRDLRLPELREEPLVVE